MAEKKKTTVAKKAPTKTARKAKSPAKKTTSRAKSTAQKVAPKATTKAPVKKTVKKNTAKAAAKATPVRFFSWGQWKQTLAQAVDCWKGMFNRYALIVLLSIALQILGVAVLGLALVALAGGSQGMENLMANLMVGTPPESSVVSGILLSLGLWFVYAVVIGLMSKVAILALVREQLKGKKLPSVRALFWQEGWRRAGSYFLLGLLVVGYVAWPLVGLLAFVFSVGQIEGTDETARLIFPDGMAELSVVWAVAALCYLLYAGVRMIFALPMLIQSGKGVMETFRATKELVTGNWWYVALMWLLFVLVLYAVNMVLGVVSYFDPVVLVDAVRPDERVKLTDLLAFLLSLFIFAPIASAFQYGLMLQTAKNKGN